MLIHFEAFYQELNRQVLKCQLRQTETILKLLMQIEELRKGRGDYLKPVSMHEIREIDLEIENLKKRLDL